MHKFTSLAAVLLLAHLLVSRQVQASLDDFNLGVGHSGSNELTISADSPGEFDYSLYLRTADNTATAISVHYVGVNNLQRAFHLVCGTDEPSATNNANSGTCITGGPFVRGSLVAGNDNQFARAKNFTLFCGTVQVTGEATTQNLISDLYNNSVKDFLDNGASSTWCPTSSPTAIPTATPTKITTPTNKVPTPTVMLVAQSVATTIPTPTLAIVQSKAIESTPENNQFLWLMIGGGVVLSTLIGIAFLKRIMIKTYLDSLSRRNEDKLTELPDTSTIENWQDGQNLRK